MKIIATSDIHGRYPKREDLVECDTLIIGGDLCPVEGSHSVEDQTLWLEKHFSNWIETIDVDNIIIIAGNHDFGLESNYGKRIMREFMPDNVHYLEDEYIEIDGKSFYGTPWTPNLPMWAFPAETEKAEKIFAKIPNDLDVLISHGPPRGYGDKVSRSHVGSEPLLHAIEEKKPKIVVCGHIHEGYGYYPFFEDPKVDIYCVSYLDRNYQPANKPVEIEI